MRLLFRLVRGGEVAPYPSEPRWQKELQVSLDAYQQAESLAEFTMSVRPSLPRILPHEDVPAVRAYAYEIAKSAWYGSLSVGLTGAIAGAYLGYTFGGLAALAIAPSAALIGVCAGYYFLGAIALVICRLHKRICDNQAEKAIRRLYASIHGATPAAIRIAAESVRNDTLSKVLTTSEGRRALAKRSAIQLDEIALSLSREHASSRDAILRLARHKSQVAADFVRNDSIALGLMHGSIYARQHVQACARKFPINDGARETVRAFSDEMESALSARQMLNIADGYLSCHQDEESLALVLRGFKYLIEHHPLISSTDNGRHMLEDKIHALLAGRDPCTGSTYEADEASARYLLHFSRVKEALPEATQETDEAAR